MAKNPIDSRDLWRKLLDPVRDWYDDGGTVEEDPSDEEILRLVVHDLQADSKRLMIETAWIACVVRNLNHLDYTDQVEETVITGPLWAKVSYMLGMGSHSAVELIKSMNLDPEDDVRSRNSD